MMKTLNDLKQDIENLLKEHPEWGALPLVYCVDDEGNSYHKVNYSICQMQFHNINEHYLELVDVYQEGTDIVNQKDVNAICIN